MAATLADVAKAAGVSLATASRVFGGPEKVSEATRQKVTKAAESLGYVANSTARALATGSSGLLGMVIPDLSSSYFAPLISAVQTEVEESGCELIIVDSRGKTDVEVEIAQRLHGRVDGLILASPRSSAQALSAVANRIPLVTVNRELPGISSVSIDVTAGLTKLCALLIKRGHRRIAYIGGPRDLCLMPRASLPFPRRCGRWAVRRLNWDRLIRMHRRVLTAFRMSEK